jgi:hypothetical protein
MTHTTTPAEHLEDARCTFCSDPLANADHVNGCPNRHDLATHRPAVSYVAFDRENGQAFGPFASERAAFDAFTAEPELLGITAQQAATWQRMADNLLGEALAAFTDEFDLVIAEMVPTP